MPATAQPQASIYEATIENAELEQALEERERQKTRKSEVVKAFNEVDVKVKGLAEAADLGDDAPVRVGRFVLTRKTRAARSVSFETQPSSRLQISMLEDAA